jgi:hypothetical protein
MNKNKESSRVIPEKCSLQDKEALSAFFRLLDSWEKNSLKEVKDGQPDCSSGLETRG